MGLHGDMGFAHFASKQYQASHATAEKEQREKQFEEFTIEKVEQNNYAKAFMARSGNQEEVEEKREFAMLSVAKETKKPSLNPAEIPQEEIEKAGGLKNYVIKAVSVELFKGNYENAVILVTYLKSQNEKDDEPKAQGQEDGFSRSSISTVTEKIKADDYDGALADIAKMQSVNDSFAQAFQVLKRTL